MKIDFDKITYGDGHGNPFNHFKNIYYDGRYIGRTFVKSSFLTYDEKTVIYFSGSPSSPYPRGCFRIVVGNGF